MRALLFVALLAILSLSSPPALSQPTRSAAVQRLSVEVKETDHYRAVGVGYGAVSVDKTTSRSWRLLADDRAVNEVEFYRIAGDNATADRVARIDRRGKRMYWTGVAIVAGGLAAFLTSSQDWNGLLLEDENGNVSTQAAVGVGAILVGGFIGFKGDSIVDRKETSLQQAIRTADRYNPQRY